jgi:uncharacterized metal-binding protein YceD (DUF177 family)
MLKFNLRHLDEHAIRLKGELPVAELDFGVTDELVHLEKPLRHDLQVEELGDSILVTGSLRLILDCECVRCLKAFEHEVALKDWALHLPLEGEDKVSIDNDCIDLTPFVREDMLLEFPQHPLCKPECAGLKKKVRSQASGQEKIKPSAWVDLDKLKL